VVKRKAKLQPELSQDAIRTAALRLIDDDGLDAFSTRKLGAALGCEAMAIYWYYPSKDALLDAVVDKLMASVAASVAQHSAMPFGIAARSGEAGPFDASARDWIAVLRAVAHAYRKIAHDHPQAFPLLATRRFATEGTYAFLEQLFVLARAQGLEDRVTARFYRVVSSYCSGFALNELAAAPPAPALRRKFPRVDAVARWLAPEHLDDMFAFGLELQLAALVQEQAR